MAKFIKAAEGYLLHRTGETAAVPAGAEVVEFDEATNPELLASLSGQAEFRWQDHTIAGGQIIRKGNAVAINPPRTISDEEALSRAVVAVALLTLDELNALRQWITSFKAAVNASSSIGDLRTRVAALPNVPDRTRQQLLTSVRGKLTDVQTSEHRG